MSSPSDEINGFCLDYYAGVIAQISEKVTWKDEQDNQFTIYN